MDLEFALDLQQGLAAQHALLPHIFFLVFSSSVVIFLSCILLPGQTARDDEGQRPVGPAVQAGEDAPLLATREPEG